MCTGWHVDNQLKKLVRILTCDDQEALASFRKVGQWSNDDQRVPNKIFQYLLRLVANRALSLSQHSTPPVRYATLLDDHNRQWYKSGCSEYHEIRLAFHQCACETSHTAPMSLTTDVGLIMTSPRRLLMTFCESHQFRQFPAECKALLKAMVHIPADSKIIEDVHQCVRLTQKTRAPHEILGVPAVQNLVSNSKVLASRATLTHPCALDRQFFCLLHEANRQELPDIEKRIHQNQDLAKWCKNHFFNNFFD